MTQGKFILKSIIIGILLYVVTGFLLAHILLTIREMKYGTAHAHSMIHLIYFFLPAIGAGTGLVLGFIFSATKKVYDFKEVKKQLLISIPFSLLVLVMFVVIMGLSG